MAGVITGGDVGDGTFTGEVLSSVVDPVTGFNTTEAVYHFHGSKHSFTARIQAVQEVLGIGQKGVIKHTSNTTTELYKANITASSMTITGMINVKGKGYSSGFGPGKPVAGSDGGSYGGEGGGNNGTPGSTYGSYNAPINLGSGGTTDAGGGAVLLTVTSALSVTGSIIADGNGGKVSVLANKRTSFAGKISAHGGAQGGDGGTAEVSSHADVRLTGKVYLSAKAGKTGTFLLDPATLVRKPAADVRGLLRVVHEGFETLRSIFPSLRPPRLH